jgi:hypothetical protein
LDLRAAGPVRLPRIARVSPLVALHNCLADLRRDLVDLKSDAFSSVRSGCAQGAPKVGVLLLEAGDLPLHALQIRCLVRGQELNATAASIAANDFLFTVTGLTAPDAAIDYLRVQQADRDVVFDEPRRDTACPDCSATRGRLALGDLGRRLPTFFTQHATR